MPRLGFLPVVPLFIRFDSITRDLRVLVLTCVGHNASSASPGWSLLPSTVIIVLALVNSTVSPAGTSSISTRPGSTTFLPVSTASTGLLHLSVGACVHHVRSDTELCMWPLLCAFHIQCVICEPTKKIPSPCQRGKKISGGILKRGNCITVGWTSI